VGRTNFALATAFILFHVSVLFAQNTASIANIKHNMQVLTSDSLAGRGTGQIGQQKAAEYIISQFKQSGLTPVSGNDFSQYFELKRKHVNEAKVASNNTVLMAPWHFHFVSGYNHADTIIGRFVFAGFGTPNELSKLDLTDAIIAFIANSPEQAYMTILKAREKYNLRNFFVLFEQSNYKVEKAWKQEHRLSKYMLPDDFNKALSEQMKNAWAKPTDSVNIAYCFTDVLDGIFGFSDAELSQKANLSFNSSTDLISGITTPKATLIFNFYDKEETTQVRNIAGMIYGKNRNQTVIVSAHYDHLGIQEGDVFFGADDNGSGSTALLELAKLCAHDQQPERNILFVAFSAEELGLYGSKYFTQHPLVNLDSIVMNINIDMVGRCDNKHNLSQYYLYLLTAGRGAKDFYKEAKKLNPVSELVLSDNPGKYEKQIFLTGSDHYNFYDKGVPVSVLFTGLHDDYHTPADTPDKIRYDNLTYIIDFAHQYVLNISNDVIRFPVRFKK